MFITYDYQIYSIELSQSCLITVTNNAKLYKHLILSFRMPEQKLFPDIKKVMRNCIVVGITAGIANFKSVYPPSLEMLWTVAVGFVIAFGIEFVNAYKKMPKPHGHRQDLSTFFLS